MWKVADDDDVLDLSLKNSVASSALDDVASPCNTLSASATASSPVIHRHSADIAASLAELDRCTHGSSSDDEETVGQVTCTAAALCSSCTSTVSSKCPLHVNPRVTLSYPVYGTVRATPTLSDQPPVFDLCVRSTTSTSARCSSALSTLTTCSDRSTSKRAREHSGQDSSSSSSTETSSVTTYERRCCSEPVPSDDVDHVAYVERRRKNNEAAKRSRDARRLKERQTAMRAAALQQENVQLKAELVVLRNQAAKLHCLLYNKLGI